MEPVGGRLLAGRYRVGELLGWGGFASVFDAYDERLERRVAIKQLRPDLADDAAMRRRFEQEARMAARLMHPNVVAVYDTGTDGGLAYLVMERLSGRTLAHRIAGGPVPAAEAAAVGADVLAALHAAHVLGLVHRDVKPGNILLTDEGRAKLADFGIAKSLEPATGDTTLAEFTSMGLVAGTPVYLAPERLAGQAATAQSDLFAVGVVIYEALTGKRPVGPAPEMPGVPPALADVVRRAMSPSAGERYESADRMASALHAAAVDLAETATTTLDGSPSAYAPSFVDDGSAARLRDGNPGATTNAPVTAALGLAELAAPATAAAASDAPPFTGPSEQVRVLSRSNRPQRRPGARLRRVTLAGLPCVAVLGVAAAALLVPGGSTAGPTAVSSTSHKSSWHAAAHGARSTGSTTTSPAALSTTTTTVPAVTDASSVSQATPTASPGDPTTGAPAPAAPATGPVPVANPPTQGGPSPPPGPVVGGPASGPGQSPGGPGPPAGAGGPAKGPGNGAGPSAPGS